MRTLAAILAAGLSVFLQAQTPDVPRADVSMGYAFTRTNFPLDTDPLAGNGAGNLQGWSASATVNVNRWFGIIADFGGYYGSATANNTFKPANCVNCTGVAVGTVRNINTFVAGPQFSFLQDQLTFFVHPLFGAAHVREEMEFFSNSLPTISTTSFSVMLGGGLDYALSRHFAVRGQVDYFSTRLLDNRFSNIRVSPGIVFRFGG
jgi:opacity protein-like surface antigen